MATRAKRFVQELSGLTGHQVPPHLPGNAVHQLGCKLMLRMKRIAIVEDNPDNQLLVCALLEDFYELVAYENGDEALLGLRASPPDLVLLDISLPGMDGIEV